MIIYKYLAIQVILGAAVLAGCAAPEGAVPPRPESRAVGNHNNLFVAVPADVDGAEGFRFWMRDARGTWHAPPPGQGRIAAAAAWREHLLVFFPTGRYGLFGLDRPDVEPPPAPSWAPAAAAEDGLAVDAFGWDADSGPLYGRLLDGAWKVQRLDVALDRQRVLDPAAAHFAGRPYLVWREEVPTLRPGAPNARLRFVYAQDGRWVAAPPSRIYVASAPSLAATPERMVCLYRRPAAGGEAGPWAIATYETADEDFHEAGDLRSDAPIPPGPIAIARQGGRFYLVAMLEGTPHVADLDVATAGAGPFAPIPAARPRGEAQGVGAYDLVLLGVVAAAFVVVMALHGRSARQRAGAAEAPVGPAAAPLWRRGAAVLLDYLILAAALIPIVLAFFPEFPKRILEGRRQPWQEVLPLEGLQMVLMVAYFTVAEAVWGRTVGKAALGIEVRHESGRPPTWGQAALRNVLRVVDELPMLYLVGLVSILLGPRAQRLGDRAARTLVVMREREDRPPG